MPSYEIFIPKWRHAGLNELISAHWRKKHQLKSRDKCVVHYYTTNIPKATGKRRIDLHTVLKPYAQKRDFDNEWKGILDALVSCGLLVDDNRNGVEIGEATYSRDWYKWGTKITLTDVN